MRKNDEAGFDATPRQANLLANKLLQTMSEFPALLLGSGKNSDLAIDQALAHAGALFSASRVYVMLDEKDGRYLRNAHEWVNQHNGPSVFSWPLYDYEYDIPSMKGFLEANPFFAGHVRDMPDDLRNAFHKQNVKSIVISAIVKSGTRIGLIGVDFCEDEKALDHEHRFVIQYLAGMVALALERKQYYGLCSKLAAIRNTISDLDPLFDGVDQEAVVCSPQPSKPTTLLDAERRIIIETLELYNGNKLKSAKHLGLTWPSLDRRCKKLGIEVRRR